MLTLSSLPDFQAPELFPKYSDKIVHLIEYMIWGILFLLMLKQEDRIQNVWRALFIMLIFGVILGILDEFHQMFVSGRNADIIDLIADSAGLAIAMILFRIFYRKPRYYLPRRD